MARKSPKAEKKRVSKDTILAAALDLAAVAPWENVTLWDIASHAGATLDTVRSFFPNKDAIVAQISQDLDSEVVDVFHAMKDNGSVRDRLFDVLMERFDLAGQNRAAHISIAKAYRCDPKAWHDMAPVLAGSMRTMLDVAHVDTNGVAGAARVFGLTAGYIWVMRTWVEDESPDLGKTMAALDQTLGRLEQAANSLSL